MPYLICVWRILFTICSYSAVTSVASASSLDLTSLSSSLAASSPQTPGSGNLSHNTTESFRCRRGIVDSELGDNITSHITLTPWFNSVFVLFPHNLLPPPFLRQSRTMNELMNNLFSWNLDFFLQSVFLSLDIQTLKSCRNVCEDWKDFIDTRVWGCQKYKVPLIR